MINKKSLKMLQKIAKSGVLSFLIALLYLNNSYALSLNLATAPLGEDKGFVTPVGITTDGTDTFVADYGANKVFKILTSNFSVSQLISVEKPICIAYYNTKLYVFSETLGGRVYNASNGTFTGTTFGAGVVKPSDIVISPAGVIYISDLSDNKIKTFNATDGSSISSIGDAFPINGTSSSFGNGQFYLISGLAYDSLTNRLIVSDSGNTSPKMQIGSKYNYKTRTWIKSSNHAGKPKGKIQIYDTNTSSWIRQTITHGSNSSYGQLINTYGVALDNNYIYVADGISKTIMVINNVANDSNAPLWSSRSAQDQQELKVNEVPVADAPNVDPTPAPARYTTVQVSTANLGAFAGGFILFKDMVKVGSYLVVTDTTGRVFYFTIS